MNTIYFVPKEWRLIDAVQALAPGRDDLVLPSKPVIDAAAVFGVQLGVQFFLTDDGMDGDKAPVAFLTHNMPGVDDGIPCISDIGTPQSAPDRVRPRCAGDALFVCICCTVRSPRPLEPGTILVVAKAEILLEQRPGHTDQRATHERYGIGSPHYPGDEPGIALRDRTGRQKGADPICRPVALRQLFAVNDLAVMPRSGVAPAAPDEAAR